MKTLLPLCSSAVCALFVALDPPPPPAVSDEAREEMSFALGSWSTSGTQRWADGSVVRHKGIVECRPLADGVGVERVFWAAFENGHSLGGRSVHRYDAASAAWLGSWTPTIGSWDALPAVGRMEGEEYVEVGRGADAVGRFVSRTRFFDIASSHYEVATDLFYDSGATSEGDWRIRFERLPEAEEADELVELELGGRLDFLVGSWVVSGSAAMPDGSRLAYRAFVDGHEGARPGLIEQEVWGAMENGGALRGTSFYEPGSEAGTWSVRWRPLGRTGTEATGGFDADGVFTETSEVALAGGGSGTVHTTYSEITTAGYRVRSDVVTDDGETIRDVWEARFRRIE